MRTLILIVVGIVTLSCLSSLLSFHLPFGLWDALSVISIWLVLIAVGLSISMAVITTIAIVLASILFSVVFAFWPIALIVLAVYLLNKKTSRQY